ncbi:MAG: hypothetical protein LBV18_02310 [Alistipes sp.]|jgi:hypothetical protein|nr:hypothetical protein [Alistipes sp.]
MSCAKKADPGDETAAATETKTAAETATGSETETATPSKMASGTVNKPELKTES